MSRPIRCSNCRNSRMLVGKKRLCKRPGAKDHEVVKASHSCSAHDMLPILIHEPGPRTMERDGRGNMKLVIGRSKIIRKGDK